jgi:hypothetical protein
MRALTATFEPRAHSRTTDESSSVVTGGARAALRLEGLAAFAAAVALYGYGEFSWPLFALLFLAPDLSMLGYALGPRIGAVSYNLAHSEALAIALAAAGFFGSATVATAAGLICIAHIGFDRALGYGLKYSSGFRDTHLSRIGR